MKRDCASAMGYPIYPQMVPNFGGMVMPGQMIPMPGNMGGNNFQTSNNDLNVLSNQISNLEQRVTRLENAINKKNYNDYNSSNYQMM